MTPPVAPSPSPAPARTGGPPLLIVPYMWIGDFVRCHSVVRVLKAQDPERPVDVLTTAMVAPLLDYMPGVRKGIVWDLPRGRLAYAEHRALAARLRPEGYGRALIMSRKWKAALAPFLAGIPVRTGLLGEMRFGIVNDLRFGEKRLPRMIDQCAVLALPKGAARPAEWPVPELVVPPAEIAAWRSRMGLGSGRPVAALAPGAVGPSKRWPSGSYGAVAKALAAEGFDVWVLGGPGEAPLAAEIAGLGGARVRDLTGPDLRNAILGLAAADVAVSNDSGLLHVSAAIGTPTVGIFGPTSAWHWAPLNPIAATIETTTVVPCRPCHKPTCRMGHHACMRDIPAATVLDAARRAVRTVSA
ncbi:lipopolysaccharide heptosyltransferase II [Rhodoplanes sp. TEM]|uniref:lipopolysaccharide heptosyltransferase II n=1 Tax=Rhodoplanes tepidamans TaxID=200616 RepID=A0ABT5JDU7_RHOTP|nr:MULTISPECIES: lipopolysaccharide heptosyltransferase II [Rhodoplanes]MDC7787702.1 lipopolysaccharide heptosyltransferase II [Rhodoplanes tepidamans]MDC7986598.1 lipopolysaccharide heptosyltransferase II [Rhodoplanes sp. TEM]MDQ0356458.1 heptosyltransferase-2 [Rhodoplanes tepidamans]